MNNDRQQGKDIMIIDCTDGLKKVDTTDYWFFQDNAWDSYMNY